MSETIAKKTMKKTNANQFKKLVELMELNPDLAKGLAKFGTSKKECMAIWDTFATELNSLGPPSRKGNEWNKVWLDYKLKLKSKIATFKKDIKCTGGGPHIPLTLSPLEQAVDALLNLQSAVDPTGPVFGPDFYNTSVEDRSDNGRPPENESEATPQEDTPLRNKVSKMTKVENERLDFLKTQTTTQNKLLDTTLRIEKSLNELARYSRKTFDIKKEQLDLMKAKEKRKMKENAEKNRRHQESMEMKLKKIKLKAAKYDICYENDD